MTLTQLKYMIAVAETGNFTSASKKVFVTQPSLSMQIQKLEDELGVQIFNRTKKPVVLTKVGEEILKQAKSIISESKRMEDIIAQEKGFIGGEFNLGIVPTIMPTLLPMFLKTFLKKYPKVVLNILEMPTENIIKNLNDGVLDAGIAATPLRIDTIVETPLYYEPFVGYIPNSHRLKGLKRLKLEDIESESVLVLEDGHCFRNQVLSICGLNDEEKIKSFDNKSGRYVLKSGSFETLVNLSNEGPWMTLLPFLNTENLSKENKVNVKPFEEPAPAREISIIYPKSQLKIQIIEALQTIIQSIVRGEILINKIKLISP